MIKDSDSLFDGFERSSLDWAQEGESYYSYLNRTGREAFCRIRRILDAWFLDYPINARHELRSRFVSEDNSTHSGAFFELYIHALFIAQDFVIEVHPSVKDTDKSPDFLIVNAQGQRAIVECKVIDPDECGGKSDRRLDFLANKLARVHSPDFFLWVDIISEGESTPSAKTIAEKAAYFLDSLCWDDVIKYNSNSFQDFPAIDIVDGRWTFRCIALPKKRDARGKENVRTLGHLGKIEAVNVPSRENLVKAITRKAARYGKLDVPYLIAVNRVSPLADEEDIGLAMFGNIGVSFNTITGTTNEFREPNGFWIGPKGPKNRRVSGILEVQQLLPHTIAKVTPRLWHNPWALKPYPQDCYSAPQRIPCMKEGKMLTIPGRRACNILGVKHNLLEEPGQQDDGTEGLWSNQKFTDLIVE